MICMEQYGSYDDFVWKVWTLGPLSMICMDSYGIGTDF